MIFLYKSRLCVFMKPCFVVRKILGGSHKPWIKNVDALNHIRLYNLWVIELKISFFLMSPLPIQKKKKERNKTLHSVQKLRCILHNMNTRYGSWALAHRGQRDYKNSRTTLTRYYTLLSELWELDCYSILVLRILELVGRFRLPIVILDI